MRDLIDRQAAIDALKEHRALFCDNTPDTFSKLSYGEKCRVDELDTAISTLVNLPSAQSTQTDTSNTLKALDCVERRAAIDAVKRNTFRLTFAEEQNCEGHVAWSAEAIYSDVIEGELLELPPAQPDHKWIPCSERLPKEEERRYWVCTDTGYQCQCRWTNDVYGFGASDRWEWKIYDIPQYQKVVAWMSLPEPYREEGGE